MLGRALKRDAQAIREHLDELSQANWLGKSRRDWPNYVYHYSDVRNVSSILSCGYLYSRQKCIEKDLLATDIAHKAIIAQSRHTHDHVRMYFRPRTPTQFRNEGVLTQEEAHSIEAHCPVPVFLLFDSRSLLTREECCFTNGNMASEGRYQMGRDIRFLQSLDFRSIYHDDWFTNQERNEIVFARNAEVVFPKELDLSDLVSVVCRTGAERETLLDLLGPNAEDWRLRIRLEDDDEHLFVGKGRAYIRQVSLVEQRLVLRANAVDSEFRHSIRVIDPESNEILKSVEEKPWSLPGYFQIPLPRPTTTVQVEYRLDGNLVYSSLVSRQEVFT